MLFTNKTFLPGPNEDVEIQFFFQHSYMKALSSAERYDIVFLFNRHVLNLHLYDYAISVHLRKDNSEIDDEIIYLSTVRKLITRFDFPEREYAVLPVTTSNIFSNLIPCDNDTILLSFILKLEAVLTDGSKIPIYSYVIREAFNIPYKVENTQSFTDYPLFVLFMSNFNDQILAKRRQLRIMREKLVKRSSISDSLPCTRLPRSANLSQFYDANDLRIIDPKLLTVNACFGTCRYKDLAFTTNAIWRQWLKTMKSNNSTTLDTEDSVCAPAEYKETWILFSEKYNFVMEKIPDFVITSCVCV